MVCFILGKAHIALDIASGCAVVCAKCSLIHADDDRYLAISGVIGICAAQSDCRIGLGRIERSVHIEFHADLIARARSDRSLGRDGAAAAWIKGNEGIAGWLHGRADRRIYFKLIDAAAVPVAVSGMMPSFLLNIFDIAGIDRLDLDRFDALYAGTAFYCRLILGIYGREFFTVFRNLDLVFSDDGFIVDHEFADLINISEIDKQPLLIGSSGERYAGIAADDAVHCLVSRKSAVTDFQSGYVHVFVQRQVLSFDAELFIDLFIREHAVVDGQIVQRAFDMVKDLLHRKHECRALLALSADGLIGQLACADQSAIDIQRQILAVAGQCDGELLSCLRRVIEREFILSARIAELSQLVQIERAVRAAEQCRVIGDLIKGHIHQNRIWITYAVHRHAHITGAIKGHCAVIDFCIDQLGIIAISAGINCSRACIFKFIVGDHIGV